MAIASATEGWSLARHVLTFCGSDEGQHVWEEEGNKFYAEPSLLTAATSLNLLTFERGAEISQGRGGYQVVGQFETRRHPTSPHNLVRFPSELQYAMFPANYHRPYTVAALTPSLFRYEEWTTRTCDGETVMRITICGETPTSPEVVLVVPGEWEDEARDVWKTARGPVFTLPHDKAGMPELVLGDSDEEWDAAEQAEESQSALQPQPAPQPRPAPEHPAKSGFFGGGRPDVVDVVDVVDRAGETGDAELEEVD